MKSDQIKHSLAVGPKSIQSRVYDRETGELISFVKMPLEETGLVSREALADHTEQPLEMVAEQPAQPPIAWLPPDPPPECQTEAEKTAFAFGWFKALEEKRKIDSALDRMAENARELGLDYETAQQQEPVAWYDAEKDCAYTLADCEGRAQDDLEPLYLAPASKPWVGLTDEEYRKAEAKVWAVVSMDDTEKEANREFYETIEAKLREKNA